MLFLAAAALSQQPNVQQLDQALGALARPWAEALPALNLVWILGAFPVTLALVLAAAGATGRARPLVVFLLGTGIEVILKHTLATPTPLVVPPPPPWAGWIHALNLTPQALLALLPHRLTVSSSPLAHALRGSFPSGHVFRLTCAVGALAPRRRSLRWGVALAAALAVTATGGHWAWDALGGWLLAELAQAVSPQSSGHPARQR
ncbi:MAG: phosphatase PAP2 family protein [Firmicutes bacterium]|nr:phosphatase PAP2 family protein [Bacillota bacterium]